MRFFSVLACLVFTSQTFGQRPVSFTYAEISKTRFESCRPVNFLILNSRIKKQSGKLTIAIPGKKPKIFTDDGEFEAYEYIGDIKGTKIKLVKREGPNDEKFYLINCLTGVVDTLIGKPVFSDNMTDFVCANNPGTDEKQEIQVCEIKSGNVHIRADIKDKTDTMFFEALSCIKRNSVLMEDSRGRYWELSFTINYSR